jgi:hypothetical protein
MILRDLLLLSLLAGAIMLFVVFVVGPILARLDWERKTRNDMGDE